jgi:signal transduction histidine kinase
LGKLELNRKTIQLNEWLTGVISPWEMAAREKGLTWEVDTPQGLPTIFMDSDRMAQALRNLLSNAVKFTPTGGKVSTTVKIVDKRLAIQVTDTGPGIPTEEQNKIFQPFYRSPTGRRIVQGMGLGLSIAHDIVIAHGGKIDLKSSPGTGSQFTLWLPLDDST